MRKGWVGVAIVLAVVASCGGSSAVTANDAAVDGIVIEEHDPTPARLSVAPASVDFGTNFGTQSASVAVVVTNDGDDTSGTIIASLQGSHATLFRIVSNDCTTVVVGHASCTIAVAFAPTSGGPTGALSASLVISAAPGGTVSAALSGTVPAGTANLGVSPTAGAFAATPLGQTSASQLIVITNASPQATGLLATQLVGVDPSQFAIISDNCHGVSLFPGGACTIEVVFAPTITGTKAAAVAITASPGGAVDVALSGTAITPFLAITPSPSDFGTVGLGTSSGTTHFTVTNPGTAATGPLAQALTGLDAGNFIIASSTCDAVSLAPGASCDVGVRFAPVLPQGLKAASLQVKGPAGPTGSATLLGTSVSPEGIVIDTSNAFSDTVVGDVSATQILTVTNVGGTPTGALGTSIGGNDPSQFTIVADTCKGTTLAPNAQCTITIAFAPTTVGSKSANISAVANPGGFAAAGLAGNGIAGLAITPQQDFGSVLTNNTSNDVSITVTNAGSVATGPLSQALTGADATQWRLVSSTCDGVSLAPGGSCHVVLVFAPTIFGTDQANLVITGAPGGTASALLTGQCISTAILSLSATFLQFPETVVGEVSAAQTVTVFNPNPAATGTVHTSVTGADPTQFMIVTDTCDGTVVASGAHCTITFAFVPTVSLPSQKTASLGVSATPGGSVSMALAGTVAAGPRAR